MWGEQEWDYQVGKGRGNEIEGGREGGRGESDRIKEHLWGSMKPRTLKTSYNIQR